MKLLGSPDGCQDQDVLQDDEAAHDDENHRVSLQTRVLLRLAELTGVVVVFGNQVGVAGFSHGLLLQQESSRGRSVLKLHRTLSGSDPEEGRRESRLLDEDMVLQRDTNCKRLISDLMKIKSLIIQYLFEIS